MALFKKLMPDDASALGEFFERNNQPEITQYFAPFPLTRESAMFLLRPESRDHFFGLEELGGLVAFSMLRGYDEGYAVPSFGLLVALDCQGQGLGRWLTEKTLYWADHEGIASIRLTVFSGNHTAVHLYSSLGFKETSREVLAHGDARLIMHRERLGPAGICGQEP